MTPKIVAIVGPTGSGKSALAVSLAKKIHGEIISADSRQIYRGMAVLSRVPSRMEQQGIPHYLLGIANPTQQYSAGRFVRDAEKVIEKIAQKGKTPIVVGGTGFYIDPLLRGITFPAVGPNWKLRAQLSKKTPSQLLALLKKLDPTSAKRVDPKNTVRLIRAIEIAKAVGKVPSLTQEPKYQVLWLGLRPDQKKYRKILEKGVRERIRRGMIGEVKKLDASLSPKRLQSLGFEFQIVGRYLQGEISKQELEEQLVRGEATYAKRQLRWFKRNPDIVWVGSIKEALQKTRKFLS